MSHGKRLLTTIVTPRGIHHRQPGQAGPVVGYEFEFLLDISFLGSAGLGEGSAAPFLDALGEACIGPGWEIEAFVFGKSVWGGAVER